MKRFRYFIVAFLVAIVTGMSLVSCGNDNDDDSNSNNGTGSTTATSPASQILGTWYNVTYEAALKYYMFCSNGKVYDISKKIGTKVEKFDYFYNPQTGSLFVNDGDRQVESCTITITGDIMVTKDIRWGDEITYKRVPDLYPVEQLERLWQELEQESNDSGFGDGTLANPFNSVAANKEAKKLASGEVSERGYYIKGKVVSIKEQFTEQYGNASFYISDDGQTAGQFLVFRTNYFGNQKWTEGQSAIKVGDQVVVYGKLTVYMDNIYETAQGTSYLISLNGVTEPNKKEDNGGGGSTNEGDDGWISVTASGYAPYYYCPTDRTTTPSTKVPTSNLRAYKNKSTGAYKVNWAGRDYACHKGYNKLTLGTYSHTTLNKLGKTIVCTDYQYFEFTISD